MDYLPQYLAIILFSIVILVILAKTLPYIILGLAIVVSAMIFADESLRDYIKEWLINLFRD